MKRSIINTQKLHTHRLVRWVKHHKRISLLICLTTILCLLGGLFALRTHLPLALSSPNISSHAVNTSLTLQLNQVLRSIPLDQIKISPHVEGSWKYQRGSWIHNDFLVFRPTTYFAVDTTYTVRLPSMQRLVVGETGPKVFSFRTETAPGLTSNGLSSLKEQAVIPADYTFVAQLASPNRNLRDLELRSEPHFEMIRSQTNDSFSWRSSGPLPQGQALSIELYDRKNNTSLLKKTVTIAAEPAITSPANRTYLTKGDGFDITFADPMDTNDTTSISFDTEGSSAWIDDRTYRFVPASLEPGKTYSYTVRKGMRSQAGGILLTDQVGTLSTTGAVTITAMSPWGNGLSQANQTLSFTFDQPVDHESAQARLSVSSGEITGFSWSGNTMKVGVKNLGYQQTVRASIAPGVKNTSFGLPGTSSTTLSFTTEVRSVKLNVPYYTQQYRSSCTGASLRMILAYRGIASDDLSIIRRMGYNPRAIDTSSVPYRWDDPSQMFVGDVNGSLREGTAAGPDAPPVAKAARSFGRGADIAYNPSMGWIAQQIHNGNPVIEFGAIRDSDTLQWQTPSGRLTAMSLSSHVRVVVGVYGEPHAPIGFWLNDPLGGGTQYWSATALAADMRRDVYNQAVVVY